MGVIFSHGSTRKYDADLRSDFEGLGIPLPADLETEAEDFPLYAENMNAVQLFFRVQTQWFANPATGARIGLNYAGVEVVARAMGLDLSVDDLFLQIQLMELATIKDF